MAIASELQQMKIVSGAIFKSVFIVSICVLLGVSLQTCQVDTEKIEVCNKACQRGIGYMESVTAYKCECSGTLTEKNPWVLH